MRNRIVSILWDSYATQHMFQAFQYTSIHKTENGNTANLYNFNGTLKLTLQFLDDMKPWTCKGVITLFKCMVQMVDAFFLHVEISTIRNNRVIVHCNPHNT